MVRQCITVVLLFSLVFIVTQCSKNSTSTNPEEQIENSIEELYILESEIDLEHESILTDTTYENLIKRFKIALLKLNKLLQKARKFVIINDNEEAKEILEKAYEAKDNAIQAVQQEQYEEAFDYIKESAYLAIEAVKLVREEMHDKLKNVKEKLIDKRIELKEFLDEVKNNLENQENPRVLYVYRKAVYHYLKSGEALRNNQLRKAGFHIRESFKLVRFTLRLLEEGN